MGKIESLERRQEELERQMMSGKKKKMTQFKFPMKINQILKSGNKLGDSVVTQYLTQKGDVQFKVCKIISGNIIIVNNKAHELNPKHLWRCGKRMWYIHREIDRKPVSNEDHDQVRKKGDDTDSDVVLIKAVLGAVSKPKKEIKSNMVVGVIIAVVAIVGGFLLFGG